MFERAGEEVSISGGDNNLKGDTAVKVLNALGVSLLPEEETKKESLHERSARYHTDEEAIVATMQFIVIILLGSIVSFTWLLHHFLPHSWMLSIFLSMIGVVCLIGSLFVFFRINNLLIGKRVAKRFLKRIDWNNHETSKDEIVTVLEKIQAIVTNRSRFEYFLVLDHLSKISFAASCVLSYLQKDGVK